MAWRKLTVTAVSADRCEDDGAVYVVAAPKIRGVDAGGCSEASRGCKAAGVVVCEEVAHSGGPRSS